MKNKLVRRIAAFSSAAVLTVGVACMFAGCTSKHPVVTITYTFRDREYAVEYELSRLSAPQTVQHFIELADAGYYDGTCIHSYSASALYGGGYTYNSDGELTEKHYFTEIKSLEAAGAKFTQSVWKTDANKTPLYTVYGEFSDNGCAPAKTEYRHEKGALVMYYTDKSDTGNFDVLVTRNDGGKGNGGEKEQSLKYSRNSATSLFYTCLTTDSSRDGKYAVFGKVTDVNGAFQDLLDAIADYEDTLEEGTTFTEDYEEILDRYDHEGDSDPNFNNVRTGGKRETFSVPTEPITVTSVKVDKY